MKNSSFFSLIHIVILLSGFNTLWYKEGWKAKLLKLYCIISRILFIIQLILVDLHLKDISDMVNWREMLFFVASSLTANMSLYKSFLFDSTDMKNLIKEAFVHDSKVQMANEKVKKDLEEHGNICRQFVTFYIVCAFGILFSLYAGGITLYVISLSCDPYVEECNRQLPWPSISIFSLEKDYGISLIANAVGMTYLGAAVLVSNITLSSLCMFPTFKLKHLQHVLKNFQYYGEILSKSENIPIRDGEYFVIRDCVKEHQKILSDFKKLKSSTQILFLMDFITHAMQTAPYLVILMLRYHFSCLLDAGVEIILRLLLRKSMKSSSFFSLIHFAILVSGFNTLWYNEGWKGRMLKIYCIICRLIFIIQLILVDLCLKDVADMANWKELVFFVASSLTANLSLYKSFLFDSTAMKNLIKEAFVHDSMVQMADEKVKKDLEDHGNICRQFLIIYLVSFFGILFSLYAGGITLYVISLSCDPVLGECNRQLPWPSISIFSLENDYGRSLIANAVGMTFLGFAVLASNVTLSSLCIFPTFKLKHLQQVLKNFQYYGEILSKSENIPIRDGEYFVIRDCIIEHQKILGDFEKLKGSTQTLFLIDFITHALQTTPYLAILMASDGTIDYLITMTASCLAFVVFELFMIYWFAQGVIDESINVGTSISLSNWYEADVKTLKLMQLLMLRSNRHLALRVGLFYDMELGVFLKICKMMYSVLTVFKRNM